MQQLQGHAMEKDRGWAWIVALSGFVTHVLVFGICFSVGMFNVVFLEEFHEGSALTAWIGSINTTVLSISVLVASVLVNRFNCRVVAIAGGIIAAIGFVISTFATGVLYLCLSFGIVVGFGLGLSYLPAIMAVTHYFEQKRHLAMGLATSGLGVGMVIYPPVYRLLVDEYGWRQTMLLSGGIILNLCVCGAVIFPIKNDHTAHRTHKSKLLHMSMLKKENVTKLAVNNLLLWLGVLALFLHIPAYAKTLGINDILSSLLISMIGITTFSGRIAYGCVVHWLGLSPFKMYTGSYLLCGAVTFFAPLCTSFEYLVAYCGLLGFLTSCYGALLPAIVTEYVGLHRMANAYGFLYLYASVGSLLGPPAAGWIYDARQTYHISFYFAGAVIVFSALVLMIPPITERLGLSRGGWSSMMKTQLPTSSSIHDKLSTYQPEGTVV